VAQVVEPNAGQTGRPPRANRPSGALAADDIAQAVMFALTQPPHGT